MSAVSYILSAAAQEGLRNGTLETCAGGVRDVVTKKIVELAKPVAQSTFKTFMSSADPFIGVANLASSLGTNVQCALIKKDVGIVNQKIDTVLSQCTMIANSLGALPQIQVLSWVGTAFSLANVGISIVGFYATLNKLNGVNKLIQDFYDQYRQDRENDIYEKFYRNYLNLKTDLGKFQILNSMEQLNKEQLLLYGQNIEEHINDSTSFIRSQMRSLNGNISKEKNIFKMVLTLYIVLAQTINEYNCLYYYANNAMHHMLNDWNSFLNDFSSPDFRDHLRQHLIYCEDYLRVKPVDKRNAYIVALESIRQPKNRFETCSTMLESMSREEYIHMDDILNQNLYNHMQACLPEGQEINFDEFITESIKRGNYQYSEDREKVLIPLNGYPGFQPV